MPGSADAESCEILTGELRQWLTWRGLGEIPRTLCTCAAMSSFWMMMSSLSKLPLFSRNVCGLHSLLPRLFKYSFVMDRRGVIVRDRQMKVSSSLTRTNTDWLTDTEKEEHWDMNTQWQRGTREAFNSPTVHVYSVLVFAFVMYYSRKLFGLVKKNRQGEIKSVDLMSTDEGDDAKSKQYQHFEVGMSGWLCFWLIIHILYCFL